MTELVWIIYSLELCTGPIFEYIQRVDRDRPVNHGTALVGIVESVRKTDVKTLKVHVLYITSLHSSFSEN